MEKRKKNAVGPAAAYRLSAGVNRAANNGSNARTAVYSLRATTHPSGWRTVPFGSASG